MRRCNCSVVFDRRRWKRPRESRGYPVRNPVSVNAADSGRGLCPETGFLGVSGRPLRRRIVSVVPWLGLVIAIGLLGKVVAIGARRSGYLHVNPRYRRVLTSLGLTDVERFLNLPSVIISGHPNRNVARVELYPGTEAF